MSALYDARVLHDFGGLNIDLGFAVTIFHVYMHRQMLIRIKEEPKAEKKKYCRHSSIVLSHHKDRDKFLYPKYNKQKITQ